MKNKIKIIISIALSAIALTSCKGFLEEEPILSQSTEITLSSYTGLDAATGGVYAPLADVGWYTGERILSAEMRCGNGAKSRADEWDSNRYFVEYEWNFNEDNTSNLWGQAYYLISAANNIIESIEKNGESLISEDVSEQDLNNLKAECLFLRAFAHIELVIHYAQPYSYQPKSLGVPYIFVTDPAGVPARNTVKEVYDFALADLLEAEKIIDPDYNPGRGKDMFAEVNIDVIRAYLSRVYLYMKEWKNAADYATKVIETGKYTMWTPEEYGQVWTNDVQDKGEVIFEVYGNTTQSGWGSWDDISGLASADGSYADCQMSPDLIKLYDENDVRLTNLRTDKENRSGHLWTFKYDGKNDLVRDANNVVILRLSEMYLNRAEAYFNLGNYAALSDLNMIPSHRNAPLYSDPGYSNIKLERRKELAFEGHYLFDLARWNDPVQRTYYVSAQNKDIPFPSYRWALPLPKRELEVNPNLVQNPEY